MITIFVNECNRISQVFYDSIVNSIQFHRLTCSCGHASCLTIHGYYVRSVKTADAVRKLRICRVRCSECNRTHAILLSSIVPYSQIALADQQNICLNYESGSNVCEICSVNPSIDENNVKHVLRNYRRNWREKLRALKLSLSPITELVQSSFKYYSEQFMQIHRGSNHLFFCTT